MAPLLGLLIVLLAFMVTLDGDEDEEEERDCQARHHCYPDQAPSIWGSCIAGPEGHAGDHLCGTCGSYF